MFFDDSPDFRKVRVISYDALFAVGFGLYDKRLCLSKCLTFSMDLKLFSKAASLEQMPLMRSARLYGIFLLQLGGWQLVGKIYW